MAFMQVTYGPEKNTVVALVDGEMMTTDSDNQAFDKILQLLKDDNTVEAAKLFDVASAITEKLMPFKQLSDRMVIRDGKIFLDGDEEDSVLTDHVVDYLKEGNEDWRPLVAFREKLEQNPVEQCRKALYEWLKAGKLSITTEGDVIGYKGVKMDNGTPKSTYSGEAFVDGNLVQGLIPYVPGTVVEMPRSQVEHDPTRACSKGLHVGTYAFASTFVGNGKTVAVLINPRDVVSVPQHEKTKIRVCRLKVLDYVSQGYTEALVDLKPAGTVSFPEDADVFDEDGFDNEGFDREGWDIDGYDRHDNYSEVHDRSNDAWR